MNDRLTRTLLWSLLILTWMFITFAALGLIDRISERV